MVGLYTIEVTMRIRRGTNVKVPQASTSPYHKHVIGKDVHAARDVSLHRTADIQAGPVWKERVRIG